jgi:hypothetical protein
MISRFRFLRDNDKNEDEFVHDIEPNFASWMWANQDTTHLDPHWEEHSMEVFNIRTFLSIFPEQLIVPIISITGDGITMRMENEHDPWPFSILGGTILRIVYLKWNPEI